MPVKIRLQRRGRKQRPFYHIVVADARAPRDGKFIEKIGVYNPMTSPATIEVDRMRAYEWLSKGAQPTDTARAILKFQGVMYYKHLMRGVSKGAMDQEKAESLFKDWVTEKESKIAVRFEAAAQERAAWLVKLSGKPKKIEVKAETVVETGSSPAKVSDSHKTLAELAAEKDPAAFELASDSSAEAPAKPAAKVKEAKEEVAAEKPAQSEDVTDAEASGEEAPAKEEAAKEEVVAEKPAEAAEEVVKEEVVAEKPADATEEVVKEEVVAEKPAEEAPAKEAVAEKPVVEEAAKKEVADDTAAVEETPADDLTKIEGIGPKIGEALQNAGISTFAALAASDVDTIKGILTEAGPNLASHDPSTWPAQSKMAADGDWDGLKKWQDELDGGKEVPAPSDKE